MSLRLFGFGCETEILVEYIMFLVFPQTKSSLRLHACLLETSLLFLQWHTFLYLSSCIFNTTVMIRHYVHNIILLHNKVFTSAAVALLSLAGFQFCEFKFRLCFDAGTSCWCWCLDAVLLFLWLCRYLLCLSVDVCVCVSWISHVHVCVLVRLLTCRVLHTCQREGVHCYTISIGPCSFSLWSGKWDWTWGAGNWGALICPLQRLPGLVKSLTSLAQTQEATTEYLWEVN